jgi:hypothetical protein
MAHPRGIEPRIAVLEAATVTVRSGAWYSRQDSNLHVDARFERVASADSATGVELVGRGRLELPCTEAPRLERGVSTRFHHRPVSGAGLEPAKLRLSNAGVCQLRHPDILVRAVGLEPTQPRGATGLRPVRFAAHSRARVNTGFQRAWRRAGESNSDVPKRRNLSGIPGYRLPMLSAALRSRD